jgi:hypothetical protein
MAPGRSVMVGADLYDWENTEYPKFELEKLNPRDPDFVKSDFTDRDIVLALPPAPYVPPKDKRKQIRPGTMASYPAILCSIVGARLSSGT